MLHFLSYPFMERALIAGVILAFLLALLGTFVVLRNMAFFSDGIAHASLAGVALGIIFSINPLLVAIILSIIFSIIIFFLENKYKLSGDTAIGILFTSGMALGVLLISMQPGYQPELISFLFGNILAITQIELVIIGITSVIIALFIFLFLKKLILISFDSETAYISGIRVKRLQLGLNIALAVSVVLGIKVLGIILVSALLIIPVAIGKLFAHSFKTLVVSSILVSEVIVISGIIISYYLDLPTGPSIVLMGTTLFIMGLTVSSIRNLK